MQSSSGLLAHVSLPLEEKNGCHSLVLNVHDFNTQMVFPNLWPLSSLCSTPPWICSSPFLSLPLKSGWLPIPASLPIFQFQSSPFLTTHPYLSSLPPLGPKLHSSYGTMAYGFSASHTYCILTILPTRLGCKHYHHSSASSLELLYSWPNNYFNLNAINFQLNAINFKLNAILGLLWCLCPWTWM